MGMSMGYGYDGLDCVWCLGLLALDVYLPN